MGTRTKKAAKPAGRVTATKLTFGARNGATDTARNRRRGGAGAADGGGLFPPPPAEGQPTAAAR